MQIILYQLKVLDVIIRGWVVIFFFPPSPAPIFPMYGIRISLEEQKTRFSKYLLCFLYSVVICKTKGQTDTYFWMELHPGRWLMALASKVL